MEKNISSTAQQSLFDVGVRRGPRDDVSLLDRRRQKEAERQRMLRRQRAFVRPTNFTTEDRQ